MMCRGSLRSIVSPYRAPELLFSPMSYDALASDLWSMGATFAEFFTALRLRNANDRDDDSDTASDEDDYRLEPHIMDKAKWEWSRLEWERYPLFDSRRGDIGLAWSIFKIRGSPTKENWPVRNFVAVRELG